MGAAETLIQAALIGEALEAGPALVFVADDERRYIAVNAFACAELGYTREELLELRVEDVSRAPGARTRYDDLRLRGSHHGSATLTRKDGSTLEFHYRAARTRVAGMEFFVSIGFVADR